MATPVDKASGTEVKVSEDPTLRRTAFAYTANNGERIVGRYIR